MYGLLIKFTPIFTHFQLIQCLKVVAHGAPAALLDLLLSASEEAKEQAAGVIANLTAGSSAARAAVVDAGCLPPLVSMLSSDAAAGAQHAAATAVCHLARCPTAASEHIHAIKALRAVERLRALARVPGAAGAAAAASALEAMGEAV